MEEFCWPSIHDGKEEDEGDNLMPHAISVLFDEIADRPCTKRGLGNYLDRLEHS